MKRIGIFSIIIFLLVRKIYSLQLCFTEKYKKYEGLFTRAYKSILGSDAPNIGFNFFQPSDDYVKSLQLHKCDITMLEPHSYDENYSSLADIYEQIKDTLENRMKDPVDGKIYSDLIKDLRTTGDREEGNSITIRALPLFLDYGILYFRSDQKTNPALTWTDLESTPEIKDIGEIKNYHREETFYIGQYNDVIEFYYNLMEDVLNTNDPIDYKVIERETQKTIDQFKVLFDTNIIDEFVWHLNSEFGTKRFNDGSALYMRNWSSFLYNVTYTFNGNKKGYAFDISKTLYSDERAEESKAVNKGIYLGVVGPEEKDKNKISEKENERIKQAIQVVKTFTSKEFMEKLITDINEEDEKERFYDLPAYKSLIAENCETVNNAAYCERINCKFFRDLQNNHIVAAYDLIFQDNFKKKIQTFHDKAKTYFNKAVVESSTSTNSDKDITIEFLMTLFSDLFQDKYVEFSSTSSIIILIIIGIEVIITAVVTFNIIKYKNFIDIRRSSPLFLIIMLIGIIISFISIITFIGKPSKFICILRPYMLVIAFGLTFFSLLLKTFRIKVIFDKSDIPVKDSNLITYLCVLLGFELIIVTIWSIAAGMKPDIKKVGDEMHYWVCKNTNDFGQVIQMVLIVINGLALVYGSYLAYKVKNVYSEYNESKVIGLSIYGIVVCMVILIVIVNINSLDHMILFLIQSLMIILSADIILVFMFTPKFWKLHINNISELSFEKPAQAIQDEENKNNIIKNSAM